MSKWKAKRWVGHTACKHYCVNWDMTHYSVVERLKFSHKKLLHLRQSPLKMQALVVSRIMVPVHHVTWHHMPRCHNAESQPWEPQIYVANYVTLRKTYVACSNSIWPLAWKNTFTCLEVCNPNPLRSSLLVTEHTSPSRSTTVPSISGMPHCEWSTACPLCPV